MVTLIRRIAVLIMLAGTAHAHAACDFWPTTYTHAGRVKRGLQHAKAFGRDRLKQRILVRKVPVQRGSGDA